MKVRKIFCLLVFVFFLFLVPSAVNAYDYNGVTYNDNDFTKLQTFLNQPSAFYANITNGKELNSAYNPDDPTTWTGVTWENGRVVRINWQYNGFAGHLKGNLDLSDFTEITYIDCDGNAINSINLTNDAKIQTLEIIDAWFLNEIKINETSSIHATEGGFIEIHTSTYPSFSVNANAFNDTQFLNWTLDGNLVSTSSQYEINSDFTGNLTANFSNPYYNVYFQSNGGSVVNSKKVEKGSKIAEPQAPTKANYIFDGWYKDESFTTAWDFESDTIKQNTVLYAKWTGIDCTVNFVHNDGTGNITSITAEYGALITLPTNLPQREDCVIGGWFKVSDTGTIWNFNTNKITTTNLTLYAGWYDSYDVNKIKTFLSMPSAQEGKTNAQCFNINNFYIDMPATWPGVIWSATPIKKVQSINWSDRAFGGILDVSYMSTLGSVSIINCSISGINVDGVSGLKSLVCSNDYLSEIDVSTNLLLETLDCSHNLITSLDLSQNISLKELNCTGNQLATLYVSSNKSLSILNCSANLLTSLNLTQNTVLTSLTCTWNRLTALDVSYNKNLTYLNCRNNYLIDLSTSQNNYLNYIDCSSNNINSIDVSGTALLDTLNCEHNNLTSLNLSYNIYLKYLYCWDNDISSLDLSNNRQLIELYCGDNLIKSLNLTNNTLLAKLSCYSNSLTSLDISQNINLVYIECYLNRLTKLDVTNNIKLISIVCYNNNLLSLNLSQNTALVGLYCQSNQITSLDLSHNTVLKYLKCYSNKLGSLNLLNCTKLDEINCSKNLLTELDVSRIELLDYLYCNDNQLTSLKINEYLRKLYCNNNKLATLDLSRNRYLSELDCSNNQLKTLDLLGYNWDYLRCSGNQFKNITAPIGSLYNIINITSKSNGYVSIEYKNSQLSLIAEPYPNTSLVSWTVGNNIISDSNPYINASFLNGETITANFSKASVTFNSLGGSKVDIITTECGSVITAPAAPVKSGYTFAGWYKEPEYINEWNFETDVVTENKTLYAKWNNNENICSVIFDSNGGSDVYDIGVENGATLTKPADPVRDGFVFCGWYKEETFDNSWDFANDIVNCTITLYARWCPVGYNEYDFFKIQKIFNQPSDNGNIFLGQDLNGTMYNPEDPTTWDTIAWQIIDNKRYVKTISWMYDINGDLDLSNFTKLKEIYLYCNKINLLNVSNNASLTKLICSFNDITDINLNNDTSLNELSCVRNKLTSLNLSSNTALKILNCSENQLTELDISNNILLDELNCGSNKLSLIKGNFFGKTSSIKSNGNGYLYINCYYGFPQCTISASVISGSTFYNWTTSDGAEISTSSSYAITSALSDTLYANFSQTVTFYNGTGGIYSTIKLPYNSMISAPAEPIRAGYTFAGWYKEADCINAFDFNTEIVTQDINLYAKWNIQSYTVKFIDGSTVLNSITLQYKTAIPQPEPPAKTGFTFAGWYCTETRKIWDFNLNTVTQNTTLFATWNSNDIIVTFNSQGGSTINAVSVPINSFLTQPSQPTRENNTFLGWYREPQCINAWNFDTDKVCNTITLYAKWSINKVAFESNGGSVADSVWVPFGEVVIQPNIEKTGYTLAGWYKEPSFVNKWNFTSNKVTFDTTLYAKWNINSYTVNFDSKGGSVVNNLNANYNSTIIAPSAPTKTHYTFAGWYKDEAYSTAWNFANDAVTKNTTLYAKWNPQAHKITFNNNGGKGITSIYVNYGENITAPANPRKPGFIFAGWYKQTELTTLWNFSADTVAGDMMLYAKWAAMPSKVANVIAASAGYNSIKINWNSVSGASLYQIYRAEAEGGPYSRVGSAKLTSFIDTGLTTGKIYYYRVRAYTIVNSTAAFGAFSDISNAMSVPSAPASLSVSRYSSSSIKASYSAVSGANGYQIYRSTSIGGTYSLVKTTTSTSWINYSLSRGKTYYYKIRAYTNVGGVKVFGPYTSIKYVKL